MTSPAKPRAKFLDRTSSAIWFLLIVFAVGLGVGAIVAKIWPPAVTANPATQPATTQSSGPPLAVGDRIQLITTDIARPSSTNTRELTVDEKGDLAIPILGSLQAK